MKQTIKLILALGNYMFKIITGIFIVIYILKEMTNVRKAYWYTTILLFVLYICYIIYDLWTMDILLKEDKDEKSN